MSHTLERPSRARHPCAAANYSLLSGVARYLSHAMGNPLAGLSLTLELLASEPLSEGQQRLVDRCLRVSDRLGLIKENLGALGGATGTASLTTLDCATFCEQVLAQQRLSDAYTVRLEVEPGAETVVAHPGLLADALGYLLRNSTDAAPHGGHLGICVAPLADLGSARRAGMVGVRFTVWDAGPGMPAEFIHRLFVEPVSSKQHGGGAGLILAAMIVEGVHCGRIAFEPAAGDAKASPVGAQRSDAAAVSGQGCRFHLDLPGRSA